MFDDMELLSSPRRAVELAIATEDMGASFYRRLARKFRRDENLCQLFSDLELDEEAHGRQFKKLLDRVPEEEPQSYAVANSMLRAVARSLFFSKQSDVARVVEQIETRDDCLAAVVALEKSTLEYYEALREAIGSDPVLDSLVEAERAHLQKATQYRATKAGAGHLSDRL
jgi:rubrerythrin